jgi:hypothetical protein
MPVQHDYMFAYTRVYYKHLKQEDKDAVIMFNKELATASKAVSSAQNQIKQELQEGRPSPEALKAYLISCDDYERRLKEKIANEPNPDIHRSLLQQLWVMEVAAEDFLTDSLKQTQNAIAAGNTGLIGQKDQLEAAIERHEHGGSFDPESPAAVDIGNRKNPYRDESLSFDWRALIEDILDIFRGWDNHMQKSIQAMQSVAQELRTPEKSAIHQFKNNMSEMRESRDKATHSVSDEDDQDSEDKPQAGPM